MKIKKRDPFTGKFNEREIPVTQEQINAWQNGDRNIQDVLGFLSADDREFLMTGIAPESWDAAFGEKP